MVKAKTMHGNRTKQQQQQTKKKKKRTNKTRKPSEKTTTRNNVLPLMCAGSKPCSFDLVGTLKILVIKIVT